MDSISGIPLQTENPSIIGAVEAAWKRFANSPGTDLGTASTAAEDATAEI